MKRFFKLFTFFITALFLGILLFPGFSNALTIDVPVAASADDAYELGTGYVDSTSTADWIRAFSYNPDTPMHGGLRWQVNIPQGATINTAYVTFRTTYSDYNLRSNIYFHKTANANNFVDNRDVWSMTNRPTTTASVYWSQVGCGGSNLASCVSPEIKTVVQEIVDQGNWVANNYMVALFLADSTVAGDRSLKAYSADSSGGIYAPVLHVEYTVLDIAPPVRSAGQPSGALAAGTTQTTLSLATDENATCKYGDVAGTSYDLMPNTFSTTGGMSHSTIVTGLTNGTSYTYYVRCQDTAVPPHQNADDSFYITFSVASPDSTPPAISNVQSLNITTNSATITWTTDDQSTSVVNYGVTTAFGSTQSDANRVASHSIGLTGLANNTYYFQVRSCNIDNYCSDSATYNFTTLSSNGVIIGTLELDKGVKNISVISKFSGDSNNNHTTLLQYKATGSGTWITGVELTRDVRTTVTESLTSVVANPYVNQNRGVIFNLVPNTSYDVRVTYTDSDGGSGSHQGTIVTLDDNPTSNGNTYYVSTSGSDTTGNGSFGSPWRTWQKAVNSVSPGDIVNFMPGTYSTESTVAMGSGDPTHYITYQSYDPANRAVFITGATFVVFNGDSYNKLKNLDFQIDTNADRAVVLSGASTYNIFDGCNFTITNGTTYNSYWTGGITLDNRSLTGTKYTIIKNCTFDAGTASVGYGEGPYGVHWAGATSGTNIYGCTFTRQFQDAIGGYSNSSLADGPYFNSYIFDNFIYGIYDDGIEVEGQNVNCAVYNNTIYNSTNMAIASAPTLIGPTYVIGNKSYSTGQCAVKLGSSGYGYLYFYHNTFYIQSGATSDAVIGYYGSNNLTNNHVFKNNIFVTLDGSYLVENMNAGATSDSYDYNGMYTNKSSQLKWSNTQMSYATWKSAYGMESHGVWENVSLVNPASMDFRLQAGSACIDSGVSLPGINSSDSLWPFQGSAPDMGASESGGASLPDTTPPAIVGTQATSITANSATITWITNELSNSTVNYGLNTSFGQTQTNSSLVTSHSISLTGLSGSTLYYYQVRSCNSDNYCANSSTYNFTTLAPPVGNHTVVGSLSLVPAIENIAVYSNFTGDDNGNNQAILEYRQSGGSWKQGIAMTVDRRSTVTYNSGSGLGNYDNTAYKNQWRAVIFGLTTNTSYDVRVTYTDIDGGSGTVQGTITTRNDNPSSTGSTYYVATTGNDTTGNGSQAAPWQTITKAASMVVAGDTVRILPGTYSGQVNLSRSGTASNYITFRSHDPNNKAIVTAAVRGTFRFSNINYVRLKELDIRTTSSDGSAVFITGTSDGNIIEDCVLSSVGTEWWAGGVIITGEGLPSGPTNTLIQRNQITTTANGQNGPFGILLNTTGGGTVIRNNTITGGFYDGIGGGSNSAINGGPYKNSYIYNNTISSVNDDGIEVEGGGINCAVYNNVMSSNAYSSIAVAPVLVGPMYVIGNVGYNEGQLSVKAGSGSSGFLFFYHNTFYHNSNGGNNFGGWGNDGVYNNFTSKNNIMQIYGGDLHNYQATGATVSTWASDYNSFYSVSASAAFRWTGVNYTFAGWKTLSSQDSHSLWGQANFTNTTGGVLTLVAGDARIDAGVAIPGINDANSPWAYKGSAPDIGAYEYNSGVVTYPVGDLNKDGKVNLYDVSILLSKWGSVNSTDLTLCDINSGPSSISQGKIDLFDANKMMANWLP